MTPQILAAVALGFTAGGSPPPAVVGQAVAAAPHPRRLARRLEARRYPVPYAPEALVPGRGSRPSPLALASELSIAFAAPHGLEVLLDPEPSPTFGRLRSGLPDFKATLVQDGARLVPAQTGPLPDAGAWEWVVQPGRIWRDAGGSDRAVLPIALQARNANCTHNGHLILTFEPGAPRASAQVQIGGETCAYLKFDGWWSGTARYAPAAGPALTAAVGRDRANLKARLPTRTLSDLAKRAPPGVLAGLATAAGDPQAVYGLAVDGVNYVAPCATRFGPDPYCDERALPSYSLAKSLVGALGLARLERIEPGAAARKVGNLLPECAQKGWDDVTLVHLLDMASGHYRSAAYMADEDAPTTLRFFDAETRAEKLAFACGHDPRQEQPGGRWVYRTSDTFLLGQAMTAVLKRRDGTSADIYDDLLAPLWKDLALSANLAVTKRTYDDARAPFTGYGLTLIRDDAARLALLLTPARRAEASALFNAGLVDAALQRDAAPRGLPVGVPGIRYRHGFWARDVAAQVGCKAPVWVPFMSGYGGVSVVIFPNDVVFYTFGDEGRFDWSAAAHAAHAIKGLCL